MPSRPSAGKQHAVVRAEQPALVHGGQLDPVGIGMEGVFDLRRADAAIVVVVGAPQRMDAVGAQRNVVGGVGGGAAQRRFERDRAALDAGFVADLDVPARHAGVAAHGAAVFLRGLVVLQHRLDDEGGEIALLGIGGAAQAVEIVVGNLDRGLRHQGFGRALHRCDRDHRVSPMTSRAATRLIALLCVCGRGLLRKSPRKRERELRRARGVFVPQPNAIIAHFLRSSPLPRLRGRVREGALPRPSYDEPLTKQRYSAAAVSSVSPGSHMGETRPAPR